MPKPAGIKMPSRLRDFLNQIDHIDLSDPADVKLFDETGSPLEVPKEFRPLIPSLRKVMPKPNYRLSKAERDDLRQRLKSYGMELHEIKTRPRRWIVTKIDPLLGLGMCWILSWKNHPKMFWRLRRIAELLADAENHQLPKGVWSWILVDSSGVKEFMRLQKVAEFLQEIETNKPFETAALKAENETKQK